MNCTCVEKFLPLHVAGDLAGRRARAVAKHLTTCAACRHAAVEYDASRKLLQDGVASLPAEFDNAFYEEIRNSVLAQIKQSRTLAPPPAVSLSSFFNGRFAYAASLVLVMLAVVYSLHSFLSRTTGDDLRQKVIANANSTLNVSPTAAAAARPTPQAIQAANNRRQNSPASIDFSGSATGGGTHVAKSPLAKRRTPLEDTRSGEKPVLTLMSNTTSQARRNPLAPTTTIDGARSANEEAVASRGATTTPTEVSRIEIQTSDPNIRIIWLSPGTDSAQPLK